MAVVESAVPGRNFILQAFGIKQVLAGMEYLNPKVCRIMAFWAVLSGLGLLSYILLGFR